MSPTNFQEQLESVAELGQTVQESFYFSERCLLPYPVDSSLRLVEYEDEGGVVQLYLLSFH